MEAFDAKRQRVKGLRDRLLEIHRALDEQALRTPSLEKELRDLVQQVAACSTEAMGWLGAVSELVADVNHCTCLLANLEVSRARQPETPPAGGLTAEEVRAIRLRRDQGETYAELALAFGRTESTIGRIVRGTAHRNVPS